MIKEEEKLGEQQKSLQHQLKRIETQLSVLSNKRRKFEEEIDWKSESGTPRFQYILADEVLLHILSFLDPEDIMKSVPLVCRKFCKVANDSSLWFKVCKSVVHPLAFPSLSKLNSHICHYQASDLATSSSGCVSLDNDGAVPPASHSDSSAAVGPVRHWKSVYHHLTKFTIIGMNTKLNFAERVMVNFFMDPTQKVRILKHIVLSSFGFPPHKTCLRFGSVPLDNDQMSLKDLGFSRKLHVLTLSRTSTPVYGNPFAAPMPVVVLEPRRPVAAVAANTDSTETPPYD